MTGSAIDGLGREGIAQAQRRVPGKLPGQIVAVLQEPRLQPVAQIGGPLLGGVIIGLVAGVAAQPVFGNLIAGLQIAITQPIRLDDVVIVEGEWGRIEEIASAYVVVRIWDQRRLVVPLQWFIENPFQNWTRSSAEILGPVFIWLDHGTPLQAVRDELQRICESDPRWDGRVCVVHVDDLCGVRLEDGEVGGAKAQRVPVPRVLLMLDRLQRTPEEFSGIFLVGRPGFNAYKQCLVHLFSPCSEGSASSSTEG